MKASKNIFYRCVFILVSILLLFQACTPGANTVQFGALFPLTGEVASYGQKAKRGIEMAVKERNAAGGIIGKQIVVDFQDDRNDKKEAVSIMTKFATIDKVPVVFGSAGSSVTLSIAPLASRYTVLLVSPISSSALLSTEGGEYFFRTVPADNLQAEILGKWVADFGAKRVAIVYTNNSWGTPLAEGFQQKFEASGGQVVSSEGVLEGASDFRTIITKLKGMENLDAVISPTYPKEGGIFVRQVRELGLKTTLFGGDNWGSPEFRQIAGEAAENVFYTAPSENTTQQYTEFSARYKQLYGEDPDIFSAYAYDAASAIIHAVEKAGTTEPVQLREALFGVSFTGVSGDIAFKSNGDLQSESYGRKAIRDGQVIDVR